MQLEKINVEEIRGQYKDVRLEANGRPVITGMGDDTEQSLRVCANKINEIIDVLNEKKEYICQCVGCKISQNPCKSNTIPNFTSSDCSITLEKNNDWEKEFDKLFIGGVYEHVNEKLYSPITNEVKYFIRNLLK